jgi:hypothetical protein
MFDGEIDELLSSHPPTIVKKSKYKKKSHSQFQLSMSIIVVNAGVVTSSPLHLQYHLQ